MCPLSQDKTGVYFMKGAYEQVIRFCSSYNSRGAALSLNHQQRELYQQQLSYMGSAGLRGSEQTRDSASSSFPVQHVNISRVCSLSAGVRIGVSDGEPDLPGPGGHHRPSPVGSQRGHRHAHQLRRRHQDDHRRLSGDRCVHRSEAVSLKGHSAVVPTENRLNNDD